MRSQPRLSSSVLKITALSLGVALTNCVAFGQVAGLDGRWVIQGPCPDPCFLARTVSGDPLSLAITGINSLGQRVPSYTGTVTFSSSDPLATFPTGPHTFTPADAGGHVFNVVFRTVGSQSVTATDSANGFSVTTSILVASSQNAAIPATTTAGKGLMAISLALVSLWFAARRT